MLEICEPRVVSSGLIDVILMSRFEASAVDTPLFIYVYLISVRLSKVQLRLKCLELRPINNLYYLANFTRMKRAR